MKLELKDNKVFFENKGHKKEIHPFWLRERVNGENFVDKSTQQRLFDPTQLPENIQVKDLSLNSNFLEIKSSLYHLYLLTVLSKIKFKSFSSNASSPIS